MNYLSEEGGGKFQPTSSITTIINKAIFFGGAKKFD
jgi:hypothetical protein